MEEIIDEIEGSESLTLDRSFELAQYCSILLKKDDGNCRRIIINVLNNWQKIPPQTKEIWTDLIEAVGFYPYLKQREESLEFKNLAGELRRGIRLSKNLESRYFHDEQFDLLDHLANDRNVIVSAPTSFGKSLLIEEVVAAKKYKNVVIIQPTLALLDETRRKLIKYKNYYKLVVRTSQAPDPNKGNIFLFTAERVNEYNLFESVDFLVIDEFYKLSGNRDDERSSSLNNAFYYLLNKFNPKFYLLGPNIDSISQGFSEKFNAIFFKSEYSLVDSRSIDFYKKYQGQFGAKGAKKKFKEETLFTLLKELSNEQTIIYCSSPHRVRFLAKEFSNMLNIENYPETHNRYPLIEWVIKNVSPEWCLIDFLTYDIGIHDGALQKHITTSVIDYFNSGQLKYLFCTSTIIEGVNTSAKNIIYFDEKRGGHAIDYFDYSNIKGRAGRMMEHYVGKIYNFNPPPPATPIIIDIPFFQQSPIKDEVLIQIITPDIRDNNTEQYNKLLQIPDAERQIIKRNGINVYGQKSIFDILRQDIPNNYFLIDWIMPDYRQLEYVLGLAWDHLIVTGETIKPMTKGRLINMTFNYGLNQDINSLIHSNFTYNRGLATKKNMSDKELMDQAIQDVFQVMKHWFEYKVPKWLSVMNEIQKFICEEKGIRAPNYTYYANLIENDFLRQNMSILAEYGIPSSAIKKIQGRIPEQLNEDLVLGYIKQQRLFELPDLIDYEKKKILDNLS